MLEVKPSRAQNWNYRWGSIEGAPNVDSCWFGSTVGRLNSNNVTKVGQSKCLTIRQRVAKVGCCWLNLGVRPRLFVEFEFRLEVEGSANQTRGWSRLFLYLFNINININVGIKHSIGLSLQLALPRRPSLESSASPFTYNSPVASFPSLSFPFLSFSRLFHTREAEEKERETTLCIEISASVGVSVSVSVSVSVWLHSRPKQPIERCLWCANIRIHLKGSHQMKGVWIWPQQTMAKLKSTMQMPPLHSFSFLFFSSLLFHHTTQEQLYENTLLQVRTSEERAR